MALSACARSIDNLKSAIRPNADLPGPVFAESWPRLLFFDCELVFKGSFVFAAQSALKADGAECVTVADVEFIPREFEFFSIMRDTRPESYTPILLGDAPGLGWLERVNQGIFACAPDTDSWCIYCQRNEEIGILAMRSHAVVRQADFISRLRAVSLEEDFGVGGRRKILDSYLAELRKNYREF